MILRELLDVNQVLPQVEAGDIEAMLRSLLPTLLVQVQDEPRGDRMARDLAFGALGDVIRASTEAVLVVAQTEMVERLSVGIATSLSPFSVTGEGVDPPGSARILVVILTPRRVSTVRDQFVPGFVRFLKDPHQSQRLLQMKTPAEVLTFGELTDLDLHEQLLVEDALTPLKYRVYPDSPIEEVTDLMLRRGLHSVPVVGERHEFVGIITTGDVLAHLLPGRRGLESERAAMHTQETVSARDVMSRSVLCVSEDQSLIDAAGIMVNRDVEQLPVVRDGELLGLLTRGTVLQYVFAGVAVEPDE